MYRSLVLGFSSTSYGRPSTVHRPSGTFCSTTRYYCGPGINHCRCYYWASTFTVYLRKGGCREPLERDVGSRRDGERKGKKRLQGGDDWIGEYRAGPMTTVKGLSRDNPQGCVEKKGRALGWILSATVLAWRGKIVLSIFTVLFVVVNDAVAEQNEK